ncbi:MAG: 50S ribosome-binding GTPase [Pirellulales bacterium]|nr:50S ribosome-binding GTPase [Pirellulales bacterium]
MLAAGESQETVAALLTPAARGALATVAIAGPAAVRLVRGQTRTMGGAPCPTLELGRIFYVRWTLAAPHVPGALAEEVVVSQISRDRVEVHCHGGPVVARAILQSLVEGGARAIDWQAWVARDARDRIAAEALLALAACRTARTAAILLDQYHGALAREIEQVVAAIEGGDCRAAQAQVAELLARAAFGRRLVDGWRVVLAGPPNAGKSSLLNALVGFDRAIVFDQPGTTRDAVTAHIAWDGWPIELVDTAGLRSTSDPIEAAGVARAADELARADLVVWLWDSTAGSPPPAPAVSVPLLTVANKIDLLSGNQIVPAGTLAVSAQTGQGLDRLGRALVERLVGASPYERAGIPFTERQQAGLQAALDRLAENQPQAARLDLRDVVGC